MGDGTPSYINEKYIKELLENLKRKLENNETKFENIEITIEVTRYSNKRKVRII